MNKLMIIGNLTRDPELRTTTTGTTVCSFSVAVNRKLSQEQRQQNVQPQTDYFQVSAWRQLGENCAKYLSKGRKVCVIGPVKATAYTANDGSVRANLEITADDVEFLSSRGDAESTPGPGIQPAPQIDQQSGFEKVELDEEPF